MDGNPVRKPEKRKRKKENPRVVTEIGEKFGLKIPTILRGEWRALRGKKKWELWPPIPYVKLSYTETKPCHNFLHCSEILQNLQANYMEKMGDLPWNFLISHENRVYKGRGWYTEPHLSDDMKWLKGNVIDIAFFGDYKYEDPPWSMLNLAWELIEYGVLTGILSDKFKIIPYRDKPAPQPDEEVST